MKTTYTNHREQWQMDIEHGLVSLSKSAFPKQCPCCGKIYETADDFILQTMSVQQGKTGFKQSVDFDDSIILETFRNCSCGSTLMECFNNRRDVSDRGLQRRKKFGELMEKLIRHGLAAEEARSELLKVVRGGTSDVINRLLRK